MFCIWPGNPWGETRGRFLRFAKCDAQYSSPAHAGLERTILENTGYQAMVKIQ